MVGEDAVIKIGADIGGAVAGLLAVQTQMKTLNASVVAGAASIRTATKRAGLAFVALGAVTATIAGVKLAGAIRTFEDYEQQVANAASVTGTMGKAFEDTKVNIDDIAKTLGATTIFSAQQAAEAMYDLASAGYNVSNMASSDLKPILDLAAATQSDLTKTTEITTATLGQFQLGISDSKYVTDVFAKTIGSSKATLEKMGLSFKYVGPIANMFGNSVDGISAALGVMYNNGLKGEQAGRSMRMAFTRLAKPTADVKRVIEELGLTLEDINPDTHEFNDILRTLEGAGIDSAQGLRLFGAEAATGMMAIVNNLDVLSELEEKLESAGGAAEDMAAKQLDTLKGSSILLKSAIENLKIEIGEKFAPTIIKLNNYLRELVLLAGDKVDPAFEKMVEILKMLSPSVESAKNAFHSMRGILSDVLEMLPGTGSGFAKITDMINSATESISRFLAWVDEHPQITKLALTIMFAVTAFSHLLPIIGAVQGVIAGLLAMSGPLALIFAPIILFAAAWKTNLFDIRDKTESFVAKLKDLFSDGIIPVLKTVMDKFTEFGQTIIDKVVPVFDKLGNWVSFERLMEMFEKYHPIIRDGVGGAFTWLGEKIDELSPTWDNLKSMWGSLKGIFGDVVTMLKDTGVGTGDLSGVVDILKKAFNAIPGVINRVTGAVAAFLSWLDEHPEIYVFVGDAIKSFSAMGERIKPILEDVVTFIVEMFDKVSTWWDENGTTIMEAAAVVFTGISTSMSRMSEVFMLVFDAIVKVIEWVWPYISTIVSAALDIILDLITLAAQIITGDWESAWETVKDILSTSLDLIIDLFNMLKYDVKTVFEDINTIMLGIITGMVDDAEDWGKNLMQSFIDGIKAKFDGVRNAAKDAIEIVEDYLGFHSPTREGPGKDVMAWGPNMVDSFAEGVLGNTNVLNDAFSALTAPAAQIGKDVGKTISTQNTFNININDAVIRDETDIDVLVSKIENVMVNNTRRVNV